MDNKFKTLFSNSLLFAVGNIGSKFIMFFLLPLYTNVLSTEQYGITELVVTGSNLLIPFISLSIQDAVLRFGLDKKNSSGQVLKNACLVLFWGTIVACCLTPLLKLYTPIVEWSFYFLIISLVQMYRIVFSLYIKAVGKSKLFAIDTILYTLLLAVFNIIFLLILKMGISGYFIAMIGATMFSIVFLFVNGGIINDLINSTVNKSLLKQMLVFSVPMIINAVSWWVTNSSDRFMLDYFRSAHAVGIYSAAAKMPSLLTSVTGIFTQAWTISSVAEYDSTKDESFYKKIFSGYNLFHVILASLLVLIIKPFMQIYVGKDFFESWQYVPYLLLAAIFNTYSSFFGVIYTSAKKNISVTITTLISASINIILNFILIPKIGILGAVLSTTVAYMTIGIYRMFDSRRYFRFYIDFKRLFLSLVILIVQCIIVSINYHSIELSVICIFLIVLINFQPICSLGKSFWRTRSPIGEKRK